MACRANNKCRHLANGSYALSVAIIHLVSRPKPGGRLTIVRHIAPAPETNRRFYDHWKKNPGVGSFVERDARRIERVGEEEPHKIDQRPKHQMMVSRTFVFSDRSRESGKC